MLFVSGDKDTVFLTKSKAFYYFLLQKLSNLLKFRMYGSFVCTEVIEVITPFGR